MASAAMLSTLLFLLTACHSATSSTYYETPTLEALSGAVPSDAETGYLLPRIAAKLRPHGNNWETAPDPHFYLLTELDRDSQAARRVKRNGGGPSLSIVNPLDVLRQRLLLEIARRRMRQSEDQILANRELLKTIGKRDVSQSHRTFDVVEDETDDVDDEPAMTSTDNNRSPQSAEWQATSHSRWNRQYSSQQQS